MFLIPPYTGNPDLDSFLYNVYLGINAIEQNQSISVDEGTGIITDSNNNILGFLYRYLSIKYADDNLGAGISDVPTNKLYFGIYNSDQSIESTNPADYTWIPVDGSFGNNKYLWVLKQGNRQVSFYVGEIYPDDANWILAPVRSLDLDRLTTEYKKYLTVRYADDSAGNGLSTSPINKKFYGVYSNDSLVASTDPKDYEWSPFDFGTTYELYYRCYGGRSIEIAPYQTKPVGLLLFKDNSFVNLDVTTFSVTDKIGIIDEAPLTVISPARYILVKYADNINGGGISNNPAGKSYFGLLGSDILYDNNVASDFLWFSAGGNFGATERKLWYRSIGNNIVTFDNNTEAPDSTGWYDVTSQSNSFNHIDVYSRSGTVVTDLTSPSDGRIGYTQTSTGVYNINLDPYGQGAGSGGFSFDPADTAEIVVDQFGRVLNAGALDQVRFSLGMVNAAVNQSVFNFSNEQANQVLFFKNGILLQNGTDYTRTSTTLTLAEPCIGGESMMAYYIRLIDAVTSNDKVPFTYSYVTLSNGQTIIPRTSIDGSELLFINGVLIVDTDYTYLPGGEGYLLKSPATGGVLTIIEFAKNNANALIFTENYTEKSAGSTIITYPTPYQRNSSLIWFNGVLLKPTADYSIPGSADIVYNAQLIGVLDFAGQPVQYASFKSAGPASVGSLSSAGVLGYDIPIEIEKKLSIRDMFLELQSQVESLQLEVKRLKGEL
jgi:hypothetical protein